MVQPTTKTRIDLGLKIKDKEPDGRLENSGPFGTMCTHRIRLESAEDFDAEVVAWQKNHIKKQDEYQIKRQITPFLKPILLYCC